MPPPCFALFAFAAARPLHDITLFRYSAYYMMSAADDAIILIFMPCRRRFTPLSLSGHTTAWHAGMILLMLRYAA